MKPFEYVRAGSAAEAVHEVAREASKFLGGGTNLVDLMRYGVEAPDRLIDVTRLPLARIVGHGDGLRIGALVRNSDLAEDARVKVRYPMLSQAILAGASPQLRNMATTGGNLMQRTRCYFFYDTAFPCNKRTPGSGCSAIGGFNRIHAILGQSPQCIAVHPSDMCVALAALDAVVQVQGPNGERSIPILEFHRLPGDTPNVDTNLARDEFIYAVDLPASPIGARSSYLKVRDRASYAFALVSVAAALNVAGGQIQGARLALGGVSHKPWRVVEAEQALVGRPPEKAAFLHAADIVLAGAKGEGHNDFKIELARRSIVRAFTELAAGGV